MNGRTIYTIGHFTHPIEEFIAMLTAHGVQNLVDVRTIPKSGHNPQFMDQALAASLRAEGLTYRHAPELGGLRSARKDSPNGGWHNKSFQGYADYMATDALPKRSTTSCSEPRAMTLPSCARKPCRGDATDP